MITLKTIRLKHQRQAIELSETAKEVSDRSERDNMYLSFAISLVESWDVKGEDGNILPLDPGIIDEIPIEIIGELSRMSNDALFPDNEFVKKTTDS